MSRLEFERSGGLAGLRLRAVVDTGELSGGERAALEDCLRRPPDSSPGADRFQYRLRVDAQEVVVQEPDVPAELQPLINRLVAAARAGV